MVRLEGSKNVTGSLSRLLLSTMIASIIFFSVICFIESRMDPDPIDGGTIMLFTIFALLSQGISLAIYKLNLKILHATFPSFLSNFISLVILVIIFASLR